MPSPVSELIELLTLERLEDNLFRGQSRDIGTKYVFGGQVLGQALSATQATLESPRGYLFRTAINLARDTKRQRRRPFRVADAGEESRRAAKSSARCDWHMMSRREKARSAPC